MIALARDIQRHGTYGTHLMNCIVHAFQVWIFQVGAEPRHQKIVHEPFRRSGPGFLRRRLFGPNRHKPRRW